MRLFQRALDRNAIRSTRLENAGIIGVQTCMLHETENVIQKGGRKLVLNCRIEIAGDSPFFIRLRQTITGYYLSIA